MRYVGIDPFAGTPVYRREPPDLPDYPCAVQIIPHPRHATNAARLCDKVEATRLGEFWFIPERAVFISPFFWVVRNAAGIDVLWYVDQHNNLAMHGIDPGDGLKIAADGEIEISSSRRLKPPEGERTAWADCVEHYQRTR